MSKLTCLQEIFLENYVALHYTIPEDQILNAKNKVFEFNEYKP